MRLDLTCPLELENSGFETWLETWRYGLAQCTQLCLIPEKDDKAQDNFKINSILFKNNSSRLNSNGSILLRLGWSDGGRGIDPLFLVVSHEMSAVILVVRGLTLVFIVTVIGSRVAANAQRQDDDNRHSRYDGDQHDFSSNSRRLRWHHCDYKISLQL